MSKTSTPYRISQIKLVASARSAGPSMRGTRIEASLSWGPGRRVAPRVVLTKYGKQAVGHEGRKLRLLTPRNAVQEINMTRAEARMIVRHIQKLLESSADYSLHPKPRERA